MSQQTILLSKGERKLNENELLDRLIGCEKSVNNLIILGNKLIKTKNPSSQFLSKTIQDIKETFEVNFLNNLIAFSLTLMDLFHLLIFTCRN